MSIKGLQETTILHILDGVYKKVQDSIASKNIILEKDSMTFKDPDLRASTGKNQLGVVSERGLKLLSDQFGRVAAISTTYDKLIKSDISLYKQYPLVFAALNADIDNSRTTLVGLARKASTILSKDGLIEKFLAYYSVEFPTSRTKIYSDPSGTLTGFSGETTEHAQFNKRFKQFLLSINEDATVVEFIDANTDAGHIIGLFNIKFAKLFDLEVTPIGGTNSFKISSTRTFSGNTQEEQDLNNLMEGFQGSLDLLAEADVLTGNLLSDIKIDIDASKLVYDSKGGSSAIEIQLSNLNQRAGRRLAIISRRLNDLQKAAYTSKKSEGGRTASFRLALSKVFQSFEGLNKYIQNLSDFYVGQKILNEAEAAIVSDLSKRSNIIFQKLIETSGSDSLELSIDKTVFNPLRGIPQPKQQKTKIPRITTSIGTKRTKSTKSPKIPKPKAKKPPGINIKKIVKFKLPATLINLPMLMLMINNNLHDQIKLNMGTGNRRDVLNYRTGRFAESARVERMSESRQGMITVFYSYMKNPYATFSTGGRQELPRTRDPKLLISRSIRELAGQQVANRMRAVSV